MRLLALDESGVFEGENMNKGLRFVGGCSKEINNYEKEKEKIRNFFTSLEMKCNKKLSEEGERYVVIYPYSFHGSWVSLFEPEDKDNETNRGSDVIEVIYNDKKYVSVSDQRTKPCNYIAIKIASALKAATKQFLHEEGYDIFAFLDPGNHSDIIRSNLMNLSEGANLYERQAVLTIITQLYFSLYDINDKCRLEIATRTVSNKHLSSDLYDISTGTKENDIEKSRTRITSKQLYKTAIATFMYERGDLLNKSKEIDYIFDVRSSNYTRDSKDSTELLYLADFTCGIIKHELDIVRKKHGAESELTGDMLMELARNSRIPIRLFDQVEVLYKAMLDAINNCEIDKYYSSKYDILIMPDKNGFNRYYIDFWGEKTDKYLLEKLENTSYANEFTARINECIQRTEGFMSIRTIEYDKGMYIAQKLCTLVEKYVKSNEKNKYLFNLNDIILRGYNHRGSVKETKLQIEKCEIYKDAVSCEEYIAHLNRSLNVFINNFEFKKALDISRLLETQAYSLKLTYNSISKNANILVSQEMTGESDDATNSEKYPLLGKVYSCTGQIYAFMNDPIQSEVRFKKALAEFEVGSPDYNITLSYYLLMLADRKMKPEYEMLASNYFGSDVLEEQMEVALRKQMFTLSLFLKSYRQFYNTKSNLSFLNRITEFLLNKNGSLYHPWELIYKNLYLCLLDFQNDFPAETLQDIRKRAIFVDENFETTLKIIHANAVIEIMEKENRQLPDENAEIYIDKSCLEACAEVFNLNPHINLLELKTILSKNVLYSYR